MFLFQLIDKIDQKVREKIHLPMADLVFWISFCLLLVIHCLENTALTYSNVSWFPAMYLFRNCLYLVMLGKIFFLSSFTPRELIPVFAVIVIGFLSFFYTSDFGLCELFIIVIASKDADPYSLIKAFTCIKGCGIISTLLLYFMGIMPTLYYNDDIVGTYNTYGFCHRNVLGANMVVICLAWFYLRYKNIDKRDIIGWSIISIITYKLALSRSTLIIMLFTIIGMYLYQEFSSRIMQINNIEKILTGILLFLLIASILGTIIFNGDSAFWSFIDRIFTKRFRFAHQCLVDHGLSVFGKNLPFISSMDAQNADKRKLILDNSYMRVLLYYGIIPGILYLYSYLKAFKNTIQVRDHALIICMLIFSIYGFSERYMLDVNYNFPLILACQSFFYHSRNHNGQGNNPIRLSLSYFSRRIE